ncbi:D-alanyl-D-alanine carboxypeptidase family protein [Aurantimonas marianensis]|uniref:D-alanyl-D-alanine carboxypeptidase n=1 Tax=Aurantimonas marianensis TaxID=2920428 RepID=A0A9X2KF30_9HYPH|nr:D-alanyl-D-alanine carboxypeptidase [Aurantimonas marianensis]
MTSRLFARPGLLAPLKAMLSAIMALALVACQSTELTSAGLMSASAPRAASSLASEAEIRGQSTLVLDYASGRTLHEEAADGLRYPASLTKMMTLYLLFEAIGEGRLSLDSELVVSENAASKPPAKIGLKPGTTIRVCDAAQAIAVKSANDVATVIAENLGGTEEGFAAAMTAKARSLGMSRTLFANASGLPDPRQISTARDMATLGRALLSRFPHYAPLFSVTEFEYGGRRFKATNKLLGKVAGVDGLKTGYIRDAGFHLAATAKRGGRRIIVVVMGGEKGRDRDAKVIALIDEYLGAARFAER